MIFEGGLFAVLWFAIATLAAAVAIVVGLVLVTVIATALSSAHRDGWRVVRLAFSTTRDGERVPPTGEPLDIPAAPHQPEPPQNFPA